MKIAIIASIWIKVPPSGFSFGAQEYLVYYLAEELKKRGHELTLFASGDSNVTTKLISVTSNQVSEILCKDVKIKDYFEIMNIAEAYKHADDFDILHNHLLPYALPFTDLFRRVPTVHTLHHLIYRDRAESFLYKRYRGQNFISISDRQRKNFPELNYIATVPNGIDTTFYSYKEKPDGDYLLYIGRMKRYKGIHTAIRIAKKLDLALKIASPLPMQNQYDYDEVIDYWEQEIKPFIGGKIEYIGNCVGDQKISLYQNAKALIFPVEREEPFGMTVIEAMSCGTPVVAFAKGAIPEIVKDQETGFLANFEEGESGLIDKVKLLFSLNETEYQKLRKSSRDVAVAKFDIKLMVDNYEKIYQKMI